MPLCPASDQDPLRVVETRSVAQAVTELGDAVLAWQTITCSTSAKSLGIDSGDG